MLKTVFVLSFTSTSTSRDLRFGLVFVTKLFVVAGVVVALGGVIAVCGAKTCD